MHREIIAIGGLKHGASLEPSGHTSEHIFILPYFWTDHGWNWQEVGDQALLLLAPDLEMGTFVMYQLWAVWTRQVLWAIRSRDAGPGHRTVVRLKAQDPVICCEWPAVCDGFTELHLCVCELNFPHLPIDLESKFIAGICLQDEIWTLVLPSAVRACASSTSCIFVLASWQDETEDLDRIPSVVAVARSESIVSVLVDHGRKIMLKVDRSFFLSVVLKHHTTKHHLDQVEKGLDLT